MGQIASYRDLQVWQRAVEFAVRLYEITDRFPQSERYGLTSQMRRASVSIASNIAEGHVRSRNDFARFLSYALSSLAEVETQLEISRSIGYLSADESVELTDELTIIGKQLNVLLQRIKAKG